MKATKEEVKVHKASRPKFECTRCHKAYPSTLDLEEHIKYDHPASASAAGWYLSFSCKNLPVYARNSFPRSQGLEINTSHTHIVTIYIEVSI